MRLIDADKITDEVIRNYLGVAYASCVCDMRDMIDEQPTAYDVGKVVKQIKETKSKFHGMLDIARNSAIDRNIEIVKAGGVSETD